MAYIKELIPYTGRNLLSIMLLYFAYKKFISPEIYHNMNELISMINNDPVLESIDKYNPFINTLLVIQIITAAMFYVRKFFNLSIILSLGIVSLNLVSASVSLYFGSMSSCTTGIFLGNPYFIITIEIFLCLLILFVYTNKHKYFS